MLQLHFLSGQIDTMYIHSIFFLKYLKKKKLTLMGKKLIKLVKINKIHQNWVEAVVIGLYIGYRKLNYFFMNGLKYQSNYKTNHFPIVQMQIYMYQVPMDMKLSQLLAGQLMTHVYFFQHVHFCPFSPACPLESTFTTVS